ncbi:glycoside hydrolase family 28 protein [Schizopora paradoxa]|uniref:galacturonan 1,4-alpha-galacturonidase n=1 Tax=Schizopora paradoxa TaxID=27342 RepID=A0A0H2S050_9AGAM|nr:glycoside hydrolase family 28 protein [Schizopora paradoxa]
MSSDAFDVDNACRQGSAQGPIKPSTNAQRTCTLKAHGAGKDDSPTFVSTVRDAACSTIVIPEHTTLNLSTKVDLTGLENKHISLQGTLKFNPDIPYWLDNAFPITFQTQITYWLLGGKNIVLDGGGTIDGSGQPWYDAFAKNGSLLRPITLTIFEGSNVEVEDITMLNSPEWFNLVHTSSDVTFSNVKLSAVSTSSSFIANTDGWDIYRSDQVTLKDSTINNGDDCVSFKPNATNILVSNLQCNGSHGISVGSLGQFAGMFDIVENVTSTNVRMSNAQNGARIKCWAGPNVGSGIVKNITFEHFVESNVDNPLIIDQCYMTNASACAEFPSNTLIQDVVFNDISGTSSGNEGAVVASLNCSPDGRCSDVAVNNINLTAPASKGAATFDCQNVNITGTSASLFGSCAST